jgi:hypothetical protein
VSRLVYKTIGWIIGTDKVLAINRVGLDLPQLSTRRARRISSRANLIALGLFAGGILLTQLLLGKETLIREAGRKTRQEKKCVREWPMVLANILLGLVDVLWDGGPK